MEVHHVLLFCSALYSISILSNALDTLNATRPVTDGGETIVSAGGTFELGFFSPSNSKNRYLGIWYKKISIKTVVWVANRETPLTDKSGVLNVTDRGILVLLNRTNSIIWSSNSSKIAQNPVAKLLESGNLVVKDENDNNPENLLWQSFDYPGDTFLPGMKLGRNRITGMDRYLTSWNSSGDPSHGDFTYQLDLGGYPELILIRGSSVQFRSGPWNGLWFSGMPWLKTDDVYRFSFVSNQREIYYSYELLNSSILSRMMVGQSGLVQRLVWNDRTQGWAVDHTAPGDFCDTYASCGAYGICNINNSGSPIPICQCLEGFVPKYPYWEPQGLSNGCVRNTPLICEADKFLNLAGVKLPDTQQSWFNESMNLEECKMKCKNDCFCSAYASSDIRGSGGNGCLLWFYDLIDVKQIGESGQDIYIKVAASELGKLDQGDEKEVKKRVRIIVSSVLPPVLLLGLALVFYVWKKKHIREGKERHDTRRGYTNESHQEDLELPFFDLATLNNATNEFSIGNKLGQGGFGPVYKGVLKDGKEIAVKRLSKTSKQGLSEFKNEVIHIAKLQHRNLVRLLGCCIEVDEMMLVYEFMSNKSLDSFIFDQTQSVLLDWPKRFHIINGIAQGLLYLHQYSRLRIIQRDLKAGNVLLDDEMNPKISDFGMARSFGENESEANTNRVVGTYGYMSPEYAIDGLYSVKSDVFSFGVLVLGIVSGKRNRGFYHSDHHLNLLGHAWTLYIEGRSLELIDASVGGLHNPSEVLRSIHVGLLCVQRNPEDRPSMSSVVLMLGSEGALPRPKQPGFFTERNLLDADFATNENQHCSANEVTVTKLEAR